MDHKLNGFNNGRDTTDGVGGKPRPLPPLIQNLVDKMEAKHINIQFGLAAQGHISTIEKMIEEYSKPQEGNAKGFDLSQSSHLWDKIAKEIGWCKETAMLHYISYLRMQVGKKENLGANTLNGISEALDEIRKFEDLVGFQIENGSKFCEKHKIQGGQLNFLISVVAAERIKSVGTL